MLEFFPPNAMILRVFVELVLVVVVIGTVK